MQADAKAIHNRLRRIEGQVRGLRRMVDERQPCPEPAARSVPVVPELRPMTLDDVDAVMAWAVQETLDAGLDLRPGGASCVRGRLGALRPYLPSGAYL